jgi:hypothetical protein
MNLQARATNIVTKPNEEWPVIAAEPTTVADLYRSYIAPLAAIPAVCSFIGVSIVGIGVPVFGRYRVPFGTALASMILQYVLLLVGVYVAAIVIEKLAPNFQSKGDTMLALKLVAYASTPVWLAGILSIFPPLAVLILIAALYSIYLFYLGLPPLLQTPQDKVIPFMAVAAVVIIVVNLLVGVVTTAITRPSMPGMY